MYAVELYRLSRDRDWIRRHVPLMKQCAEWTIANRRKTMVLEDGRKPLHWGLLPKWTYGGDIFEQQCYPLFSNLACWRGLAATAELLRDLGERDDADRYEREAADYHRTILEVVDTIYRKQADPPVLPPHVYAQGPDGQEYYQLFAGMGLDLLPFEFTDPRADYFGRFLEQDNRTFCLLMRFRRDAGPGGLDPIYSQGYILSKLHQDRIREFLLGFHAYQAFNLERDCFTSRETNVVYSSDLHRRTDFKVPDESDLVPCSGAVLLNLLRHMLMTEESSGAARYTGRLALLRGAPRRWFADGCVISMQQAPTHFGKVSFRVESQAEQAVIRAEVAVPDRCRGIVLRLRHPMGAPMKSVRLNGRPPVPAVSRRGSEQTKTRTEDHG